MDHVLPYVKYLMLKCCIFYYSSTMTTLRILVIHSPNIRPTQPINMMILNLERNLVNN